MKKFFIFVFALIVIAGGYFALRDSPTSELASPASATEQGSSTSIVVEPREYVVTYSNDEYLPKSLTIALGDTVVFQNQSARAMWPASAMHPSHKAYAGTSLREHCDGPNEAFDACTGIQPGQSWSFTFEKVGTWDFHDHLHPQNLGSITVEE